MTVTLSSRYSIALLVLKLIPEVFMAFYWVSVASWDRTTSAAGAVHVIQTASAAVVLTVLPVVLDLVVLAWQYPRLPHILRGLQASAARPPAWRALLGLYLDLAAFIIAFYKIGRLAFYDGNITIAKITILFFFFFPYFKVPCPLCVSMC
jgi:hypothetical protein